MPRREKLLHGWREPAPARPAATILLLRDGGDALEVLMTRRSATASFLPDAYVFPGGALDAADDSALARSVVRVRPDQDETQRTYATAALREAFEELGILLAWQRDSGQPCRAAQATGLDRVDAERFFRQLEAGGLELAIDRAFWLSHWITDMDRPKRFDARFFVAPMPEGQDPSEDGTEQFEPVWVAPADGLRRQELGEFNIIMPTIETLRYLQRFSRVEQVLDDCRSPRRVKSICARGGFRGGRDERFTEEATAYGELALATPDGQVAHTLDWQHDRPVGLLRNVRRLTAPNPSMMTGPGTNTYLVGDAGDCIVIDPGPAIPAHIERLAKAVGDDLRAIVCTHSHPDHSPGAPLLLQALGSRAPVLGLNSGPNARPDSAFRPDRELAHGERLRVGDSTLRVVHTPGHAANHLCLVLEEDRLLFSGDHVLNGSTTVVGPPDGNMKQYMDSLYLLAREPVDFILPAHGHVLGPAIGAIEHLIGHRLAREAKVMAALERIGGGTLEDLVPHAYDDVRPQLYPQAMRSMLAHLEKLEIDERVARAGATWRIVGSRSSRS